MEVVRPKSLDDALKALAGSGGSLSPMAGGTDLFVYLNAGSWKGSRFLDLSPLKALNGIRVGKQEITIGAATPFWEIRHHAAIRRHWPTLAAAAAEVGAWAIQHRATLGGNIANASPAGDSLPVLLAHDAVVRVRSVRGTREIPFAELYTGYRKLAMEPDELIVQVVLPRAPARWFAFFRKVGTRRAQSISKVVFAALLARDTKKTFRHVRLAWGSVAPVTLRSRQAEAALLDTKGTPRDRATALAALGRDLAPIDDIRSEKDYRVAVSGNLLEQCLRAESK
jgi:CO/xanthine dehydrogenase FAD-binding subunit